MGGFGSGRHTNIDCTDDCRSIDVRSWQRQDLLRVGLSFSFSWSHRGKSNGQINVRSEPGAINLSYSCRVSGGDWQYLDYAVNLQTTACRYGGKRYWFPVRLLVVASVLPCCIWALNTSPVGSATNLPIHPSVNQWKTEPFVK